MAQADQLKDQIKENQQSQQTESKQSGQGNGEVASQNEGKGEERNTVKGMIQKMEPEIKKALPKHFSAERMTRLTLTAVRNTPKLGECDPYSLLGAMMQSAQLGLEPNTPLGEAYLIPRKNKQRGIMEANFEMGYKGLLSLAHRTGRFRMIYAHEVYRNDEFEFKLGLHKDVHHVPADIPEGDPTYFYAVYHLDNGGYDFVVWSVDRIKRHAEQHSQSYGYSSSPWKSNFNAMAKKTVLKDVLTYAPKSTEFAQQFESDNSVKREINPDMGEVQDDADIIMDVEPEGQQEEG